MLMSACKRADALLEILGERRGGRMAARRQRGQTADDREHVLDAVGQLARQQFPRFLGLLSLMDVEADADPSDDVVIRVVDRTAPNDEPSVTSIAGPSERN